MSDLSLRDRSSTALDDADLAGRISARISFGGAFGMSDLVVLAFKQELPDSAPVLMVAEAKTDRALDELQGNPQVRVLELLFPKRLRSTLGTPLQPLQGKRT